MNYEFDIKKHISYAFYKTIVPTHLLLGKKIEELKSDWWYGSTTNPV